MSSNPTVSPLMQSRQSQPQNQTLDWYVSVENGSLAGQRFSLTGLSGPLTIGRDNRCNIRFDPNQERMVGREHARIEVRADGVYLVDNHSANGTFQNGAPISEVRLKDGDRFQLGGEVDGAEGPWIAMHLPVPVPVAVHVAPVRADAATLVTRPNAEPFPQAPRPAPPSIVPSAPPPPSPLPPSNHGQGLAGAQLTVGHETPAMRPLLERAAASPYSEVARNSLSAAEPADRQLIQRRTQLIRQIATIVVLLIAACTIGVAIGTREGSAADAESAARSE